MTLVRPALEADAARIAQVHAAASRAAYAGIMPDWYLDRPRTDDPTERWRGILAAESHGPLPPDEGARTLVVEDGARVVGVSMIGASRDHDLPQAGEMWMLYVDPAAWGTGVAAALDRRSRESLRHWGFPEALLWVATDNARARRFYERVGWRVDGGPILDASRGFILSEIRYRIALRPAAT